MKHGGSTITALGCLALLATDSTGQGVPAQAPLYRQLRYDEDYRYLRDAPKADLFDPLKYVSLNQSGDTYLSFGGEARGRYEYYHNPSWGRAPQDDDGYWLQRYLLHADLHVTEWFRAFAQFQSSLINDRVGGPRPTDKDILEVHQGFLDGRLPFNDTNSVTLRLGRQELSYGSSRLISFRESPNVRLSFDGVKAIAQFGQSRIDAFAVKPVETKPDIFDDGPDPDESLWGVYSVTPFPSIPGAHADLYYLGVERKDAMFNQGTAREVRHSFGARLWGKWSEFDYNFEWVYQFGSFGHGDISAWTAASDQGYTFKDLVWHPRLALKADVTSGDDNPNAADLQTFNPLFPRGAYFGETSLIGPANHMDVHPSLELNPTGQLTLMLDWDFFWRESTHDGIYGNAVNLVVPAGSSSARYVGDQAQVMAEWRFQRHLTLTAAYAHFFTGDFLKESTPGKDVDYFSTWLTFRF